MFSRTVYIERGIILGAAFAAPMTALLRSDAIKHWTDLPLYAPTLLITFVVFVLVGAAAGYATHQMLRKSSIDWGGIKETSALIKQAAAELVTGQQDEKLLTRAMTQANAQEGRASAHYLFARVAALRETGVFKRPTKPNPVALSQRGKWASILLGAGAVVLALPAIQALLPHYVSPIVYGLLAPLTLTGALICGFGIASADSWLQRFPGLPTRQPKLRQREVKSVAGQWHKKSSGADVPLFRGILAGLLLIAAGLYFMREYGDDYFGSSEPAYVAPDYSVDETVAAPRATPRPASAPAYSRQAEARSEPRASATTIDTSPRLWAQLPANGIAIQADLEAVAYAGWDIQQIQQVFDDARLRLQNWYGGAQRDDPSAIGHIAFRITLQPNGSLTNIELLSSEIHTPRFVNGLKDRLEAITMGAGALDPVAIVVALDFRP